MRKTLLATFLLVLVFSSLYGQYDLRVQLNDFTGQHAHYLSGSFNHWNPCDQRSKFKRINPFRTEITLSNLPKGHYSFKITRGSWQSVESTSNGLNIQNREVDLSSDTTLLWNIEGWKDLNGYTAEVTDSMRLRGALSKGFGFLNNNLDSSYKYALETFSLASKVQSDEMKAYAINLQGEVFLRLGNTQKALELFAEGLRIRKLRNDSAAIVYLYNQIGNVYWQVNDTLQAVKNYRLALPWVQPLISMHPLHETLCNIYCKIGSSFLGKHQYDSAKWYAAKAQQVGDKISTHVDLFLGDIEHQQRHTNKALGFYRSASVLGLNHDHNMELVLLSYERIATIYKLTNQADSAIYYARKAFGLAGSLRDAESLRRSGILLALLFKQQHRYDSALYYQQKVIEEAQLQLNQQKERQTLNTYFNEKIEAQKQETQLTASRFQRWIYVLVAATVLLLVSIGWYRLRIRSNFNKKVKEVEMRALRAQMNPHFIFNCLGSINRYIVKSDTKTASHYLTRFAKLIRLILDNSAIDHISLEAEIQTLQLYLDMESLRFDYAFEYEIQKEENVDEANLQLPSMLIQPYVENAIWHGLMQKEEKGKLWIRFKKVNGHLLQAEIEDNGIGRKKAIELKSKEMIKYKSYGMQISSDRIQIINNLYQLKNSISIYDLTDENGHPSGTKIVLQIPIV
ncbi:hypothetical protein C3K47_03520 [Solitalea longa]|uniref:Signal transduction histidine kinase internal region domain-containing protein n=1 Tax=Solitalea longa TaxID=2079460 RepID=A0A2S5A7F0_9SPHI|nr:histidine kinase [Solitalea longa]POY38475.1 hypothetical protein C3K47_03520 [Solitalea longa]